MKKVISDGGLLRSPSSAKDTSADQNSAKGGREKQKWQTSQTEKGLTQKKKIIKFPKALNSSRSVSKNG